MSFKNSFFIPLLFIFACQPVEIISPVEFDNSNFNKISINAKEISIKVSYKSIFSQENIEDQISKTPLEILESWLSGNIKNFGNQNKILINIIDASIFRKEIKNTSAKKYEEKIIFLYEVFFLVEYELYDDNDYLLANTTVETYRSTTSNKYISLNESELIINDLLNNSLKDFTKETDSLLKIYMSEYLY
tara:strand:+ start:493 stop:1062 length:570 start_codon:yes stop_codon:yes gene_type:complete